MKVQFLFNVEMKEPKKDVLGGVLFNKQLFSTPTNSVRMEKKDGIFTERIPLYHRHDYVIFVYKCLRELRYVTNVQSCTYIGT